jgi:hypothetical protein
MWTQFRCQQFGQGTPWEGNWVACGLGSSLLLILCSWILEDTWRGCAADQGQTSRSVTQCLQTPASLCGGLVPLWGFEQLLFSIFFLYVRLGMCVPLASSSFPLHLPCHLTQWEPASDHHNSQCVPWSFQWMDHDPASCLDCVRSPKKLGRAQRIFWQHGGHRTQPCVGRAGGGVQFSMHAKGNSHDVKNVHGLSACWNPPGAGWICQSPPRSSEAAVAISAVQRELRHRQAASPPPSTLPLCYASRLIWCGHHSLWRARLYSGLYSLGHAGFKGE